MSNAQTPKPLARRSLRTAILIAVLAGLSGCVVVPARGYYYDSYSHHRHHNSWR
jgi:hypothetical protein